MTTLPNLPPYAEVEAEIKKISMALSAAQVHGVMCGLICGTSGKDNNLRLLFDTHKELEPIELLHDIYELSYRQILEFSFEFTLLLPDDNNDINQRAEALGVWCQGFLIGLKQTKVPLKKRQPSELTDTLNDLIEIAQINYGDITSNEEDESAYYELVEYVRLAILLVFDELRKTNTPPDDLAAKVLH